MSEKTARKRLRELLDEEPGVKWIEENPGVTYWSDGTHGFIAEEYGDGKLEVKTLMTPEQAIAATLEREDTYTREECEASFVRGYSLGSLPVGSDPRWDENRQTVDEHMAELGWVRAATLGDSDATAARQGVGTCHIDLVGYNQFEDRFQCRSCDWSMWLKRGTWPRFNFCPNCGRKVVDA